MTIPVGRLRARNHRAAGRKMSAMAMIPTVKTSPAAPLNGNLVHRYSGMRRSPSCLEYPAFPQGQSREPYFRLRHYPFPTLPGVPAYQGLSGVPAAHRRRPKGEPEIGKVLT